ncbi:MAG: CNNM domain-containing protein [Collinsella sp.]
MSEMALTTAKRAVLEHEAEEGDKRAERAVKLAADSDQLLATIQVAITLVGFASSAVASTSLSDPLATWLMSFGIAPLSAIARGLAPVIITVAVAFVSIVIGELCPSASVCQRRGRIQAGRGTVVVFQRSPVRSCG